MSRFEVKVGDKVRDRNEGTDNALCICAGWVTVIGITGDRFHTSGDREGDEIGWLPLNSDFDHMAAIPFVTPEQEQSILDKAKAACEGARQSDYGSPLVNHTRTAKLFAAYLGIAVDANMVCDLNILQKISRGMNSVTEDTCVDIAGYAWNKWEVNR